MTAAPEFTATIRLRLTIAGGRNDYGVLEELRVRTGQNVDAVVLDSGRDDEGVWSDVTMSGRYQDVMAVLLMLGSTAMEFSTWRYRFGRFLMHLGLRIMPQGRGRSELSALLWTWGMKVQATVAAKTA